VKATRKKVAAKERTASVGGEASAQALTAPVKKSPAKKGRAAKVARASNATKKTTSPKTPVAGSESVVIAKKATVGKAVASRKKVSPRAAARKAPVEKIEAPVAPEAVSATATV
jgi:hypothetical protein